MGYVRSSEVYVGKEADGAFSPPPTPTVPVKIFEVNEEGGQILANAPVRPHMWAKASFFFPGLTTPARCFYKSKFCRGAKFRYEAGAPPCPARVFRALPSPSRLLFLAPPSRSCTAADVARARAACDALVSARAVVLTLSSLALCARSGARFFGPPCSRAVTRAPVPRRVESLLPCIRDGGETWEGFCQLSRDASTALVVWFSGRASITLNYSCTKSQPLAGWAGKKFEFESLLTAEMWPLPRR